MRQETGITLPWRLDDNDGQYLGALSDVGKEWFERLLRCHERLHEVNNLWMKWHRGEDGEFGTRKQ